MRQRDIYCCGCETTVRARLTNGKEIYPHRGDLADLPFWRCEECKNYVGCHHKTKDRTAPLGVIPTPELKKARSRIHAVLDPVWVSKKRQRREVYERMAEKLGIKEYHTAEIRSIDDARKAWVAAVEVALEASQ